VIGVYLLAQYGATMLPGIPAAMTNAATVAVAEKASDLVLGAIAPRSDALSESEIAGAIKKR
jgi:hypothetical protein